MISQNQPSRRPTRYYIPILLSVVVGVLTGCAPTRSFVITAEPKDAQIRVNSVVRGKGVVRSTLSFDTPQRTHTVIAQRVGFDNAVMTLQEDTSAEVSINLKPRRKPIVVQVQPSADSVTINDKVVSEKTAVEKAGSKSGDIAVAYSSDLTYDIGNDGTSRPLTLRVTRLGYKPQSSTIDFDDSQSVYPITLVPVTKDLLIDTVPTGAKLSLDGREIGTTGIAPVRLKDESFEIDLSTNEWIGKTLVARRAGYAPTELVIKYDQGRVEYKLPLQVLEKTAILRTEPAGAAVTISGETKIADKPLDLPLRFVPVDERGTLPTYQARVTLDRPGEKWAPNEITIAWENGQSDYVVKLDEILERPMTIANARFSFSDQRWAAAVVQSPHTSFKDVGDAELIPATRLTDLAPATLVDTFAISPDGRQLVICVLVPANPLDVPSTTRLVGKNTARLMLAQIAVNPTEDAAENTPLTTVTDGRHLDLMPWFSPSGDRVIFSSNRGGEQFAVWSLPLDGSAGATRLTGGDSQLLWPSADSQARQRVFYEALSPGQPGPRIFSCVVGTVFETDLVNIPGQQPRIGPANDAVVFVGGSNTTKRDLYRTSDKGGIVQKLTDTPDLDERDPAWSPDGLKVVFTRQSPDSIVATSPVTSDIWIINADGSGERRLTQNTSINDRPTFDAAGEFVYFRSSRGGKFDIWRVPAR